VSFFHHPQPANESAACDWAKRSVDSLFSYAVSNLGAGLRQQNWDPATLSKFEKNFYECVAFAIAFGTSANCLLTFFFREDKRVAARTEREVTEFRREEEVRRLRSVVPSSRG
jgi:hypothetical protein